ncbi:MAG: hypothetical protein JWN66_3193 [Sphingomonas bacterium]|uniref:hypothetical protein n=1 Tax=Sphingomonas bacterium TaxID=1895847 RepID=UPI0026099FA2|nr:hypothetical protein [Sphingomonas bacterium]MDB5706077.1 hypothetical protein [Sphingomonas bacterium]
MFELFKAECRRFRWVAIGAAALNAGVLLFFDRVVDPFQQPLMLYQLVAGIYAVAGILLGLYQAGSYRRINQWIMLLHRPLAPGRIFAAVAGGGAVMLAVAIAVPVLVLLASHGLIGARFVDARHWLLAAAALLLALTGYLAGLYVILGRRRYAWLALVPALLPTTSAAAGWGAIAVQALVVLVLTGLVASIFKPDLEEVPRKSALAGTALMVAMGAYVVAVVAGDIVFQIGWIATGTHPLNSIPPKGGVIEAVRSEGGPLIEAGLSGRHDRQAQLWREQVRLSEVFALPPQTARLPVRGSLTNVVPIEFDDARAGVRWTFSHDDMLFHGVKLATNARVGTLGLEGGAAFGTPPLPVDGGALMAASQIAIFSEDDGRIHGRITLPAGETIAAAPTRMGDAVGLVSDRGLRIYDARVLVEGDRLHPALATLPLPGPIGGLLRIDAIELLDGYLISFTYGHGGIDGPGAAWQRIVRVDGAGRSATVRERRLNPDFPAISRFSPYWLSLPLKLGREAAEGMFAAKEPLALRAPVALPPGVAIGTGLLALASAIGTLVLARRWRLPAGAQAMWTVATLVLGAPMLVALALIRPVPRR